MMKKHPKARKFALSAVASALLAMPAMLSAGNVNISQEPLLGVSKVIPSVTLALSVEFPTTYIAYNDNVFTPDMAKKEYLGYFDSEKCYQYVVTIPNGTNGGMSDYLHNAGAGDDWRGQLGDGYFRESGVATKENGYIGLCAGELDWSGNMLNYMTMSALDVVRQTLTGGNRAKGVGGNVSVYQAGDPAGENKAYLRRSMMWRGQEGEDVFPNKTGQDQLSGGTNTQARYFSKEVFTSGLINKLVPTAFVADLSDAEKTSDTVVSAGRGRDGHLAAITQSGKVYRNASRGSTVWSYNTDDLTSWEAQIARGEVSGSVATSSDELKELRDMLNPDNKPNLAFWNSGTGFYATLYRAYGKDGLQGVSRLYSVRNNTATGADNKATWFNVVVERNEKPEGLFQQQADIRVAAMSYLPELESGDNSGGDGGVLRAKMRRVKESDVNTDGTFKLNPDAAAEGSSGVINYVNKFGDNAPYDVRDPVSELYYTAIRYMRNGAWRWKADGTQERNGAAGSLPYSITNSLTDRHKDGFPVIQTWDDPLKATGDQDKDMQCYAPAIIVLGDTNTHADNNLPNYPGTGSVVDNVALDKNGSTTYYQKVCQLSGFCDGNGGVWQVSSGSNGGAANYAPTFGMAGMAYWVKTNNARPDIVRDDGQPTHIQSFFIDVLESGMLKTKGALYTGTKATTDANMQNSYYLAGKFASPNYDASKTYTRDDFDSTNSSTRSIWTNDSKDESSNDLFPLGMPKNYAVANNPQNMKDALVQAFKTVGFARNTMQSAVQSNGAGSAALHIFDKANGSAALIGNGINKITNTDGSEAYEITDRAALIEKAKQGEIPLSLRAGYKFSERTGFLIASVLMPGLKNKDGFTPTLGEVELWDGGKNLFSQYHNSSYTNRQSHVWSKTGTNIVSGFTQLNPSNTDLQAMVRGSVFEDDSTNYFNTKLPASVANPKNLIQYILGDNSQEGAGGLRQRKNSLLGTSVYSSVTPIVKNTTDDYVKTVPLGAYNEKTCYYQTMRTQDYAAMSSNEGMLHIFDMAGNEVFAYMPQTALPFIANFASPDYDTQEHRFVNDGPSLLHEVCEVSGDTGKAKTYLVGTSGRGASSVYAIDVTNDGFTPKLEINAKNDPDIGILVSSPLVVNDGTNTPVLIFSSGYNPKSNKNEGYLFFYNLATGAEIAKVRLGGSGVGAPFGYDSDGDGVADRIYVGDNDGHIWRVNRNDSGTWAGIRNGTKLLDCTSNCQPITTRPVVGRVNGGKTVVLAGTGENFHLDDMREHKQNYAYGIFDEDGTASVSSNDNDLLVQEFGTEKRQSENNESLTYLSVTQNALEDHHKGWRLVLPSGYVISSDSAFYGPKNQIATYTAVRVNNQGNSACNVSGSSLFIAVDAQNGGAYNQSLFDVDGDGRFDKSDFVGNASAGAVEVDDSLAQAFNIMNTDNPTAGTVLGDDGKVIQFDIMKFLSTGTIRRVSWREIF